MHEVIIVGGGPAGLSAALILGRAHRKTLVLDEGQGRNAPAEAVHNLFLNDGIHPQELRRTGREQLADYQSVEVRDAVVESAGPREYGFELGLADGRRVQCRRLLLATGLADDLPPIEGVEQLWGKAAFHCPYCHGFEVSGKPIAAIGDGMDRAHLALHLGRFTDDLVLCTDGPANLPDVARSALGGAGIPVREEKIARLVGQDGKLEAVEFDSGDRLARDAVFVKTVLRQHSQLPAQLGCVGFSDGTVEIDEFGRTSVPSVYAAGDMCRRATLPRPPGAVSLAASSGMVAGAAIDQELVVADFGLPNPFARKEA